MRKNSATVSQCFVIVLVLSLAAGTAFAADALTARDLGWLGGNLNLHADSPALLDLSETQKRHLHDLIGDSRTGPDRRWQNVVRFLTGTAGDSLEETLDQAKQTPAADEVGSLGAK
jgi:hypothetical protein